MQLKESIGSLTAVERAMQANLKLVPAPSYAMSRALELFELRSPHAEILERLNETRTTLDRLYSTSHAIEHLALKNPIHDMIERFTWPHRAFEAMARWTGLKTPSVFVEAESDIPMAAGLGSSAAAAVTQRRRPRNVGFGHCSSGVASSISMTGMPSSTR